VSGASDQFYRGEAGQRYQQQKRAVPDEAIPWVARLRSEKLQPHIRATDTVVEFGAGLGWNLANLNCARRIATDLEDFLPAKLKRAGVEFHSGSAALSDATAHVIICHHVLEHVEDPGEMLREARRILKPQGKILVFVPYEKEAKYRHYDPNEPNHHLFSWNAQTLGNLVAAQEFTVLSCKIGEFGYDRFASKLAIRFHLGENGFRAIRRLAHAFRPGREVQLVASKGSVSEKA
jgi:SAM-dependent methyltransferase